MQLGQGGPSGPPFYFATAGQLAVSERHPSIKDETDGVQKIALARPVLADNHGPTAKPQVNVS